MPLASSVRNDSALSEEKDNSISQPQSMTSRRLFYELEDQFGEN